MCLRPHVQQLAMFADCCLLYVPWVASDFFSFVFSLENIIKLIATVQWNDSCIRLHFLNVILCKGFCKETPYISCQNIFPCLEWFVWHNLWSLIINYSIAKYQQHFLHTTVKQNENRHTIILLFNLSRHQPLSNGIPIYIHK